MWGQIYPHAVLLILTNIILKVSCKGSLTFLIDDTLSMYDDIMEVKRNVDRISDVVFNEKSSLLENMVLVTFNDPDAQVRAVTQNRDTFKRALDAVYPHSIFNPDCWERSIKGLLLALEQSNSNSYIYVFTDAEAKDYQDAYFVKELCQRKQSQIVFVLTGRCGGRYDAEAFEVYFDIAQACSGLVFNFDKTDVKQVIRPIEESIKGNKTVITSTIVPAGVKKDIPFIIDDHIDHAIVFVAGRNVILHIKGPSANLEDIMWNENGKVIKLSNAKPGKYEITVIGKSKTSVVIVGRTDFFFTHGFSELKPKSLGDTALQPIADTNVHLSISVTDDHNSVQILSAQILDMNEKPMNNPLPLTEISKHFYVTTPFVAPSRRFKIAVNGVVKATGKSIKRIVKIPITPSEPPKILPTNTKPTVKISEGEAIEIEYSSTVKLTCEVVAFPEPKIEWINNNGLRLLSKTSLQEYPYKYISYIDISYASKGEKYKCYAVNDVGSDEAAIDVFVKEPFTVKSTPPVLPTNTKPTVKISEGEAIEIEYSSTVKLTCKVVAFPEPKIEWINNNGLRLLSKTSLQEYPYKYISYIDISYASKGEKYKCYAVNDVGSDEAAIDVFVKEPFTVKSTPPGITKFTYGTEGTVTCDITSRLPIDIHWYYANEMTGVAREIETSDKYEISASRTQLKIKTMDLDLVGRYVCKVSVKNNPHVQKSFSTRVNIDGLIAPKVQGEPEIKVTAGKTAIIECKVVSGLPAPKITWLFGGESGLTFTPLAGSETVLRISNVEEKHKGKYKCVAENAAGKDEQITTLIVQVFPKITTKSSAVYQATEGELLLKIPCVAAGIPKPIIVWKLNGRDITPSAKYSIEDGTLTIKDPKVSDTNSYTCEARNEAGAVSSTFKTYIRQAPKISGVTVKKVRIGMPASIECTIEGEPKPTITWTFKDNSGSKFLPIPGSGKVLNFPRVEDKNAGHYKCIATNELGSNEHITTLFVGSAPEIIKNSTTVEGIEGDSALRIPCEVVGNPKPVITWKLKGATIIPDSKYTIEDGALVIKNPTEKDSSLYTCEAKNYISTTSITVQATVKILPVNTKPTVKISEGEAIEIEYNSTVKLTCKVVAFPEPKIEWIKNNGGRVPSKMSLQEYPYNYISYMDISYASERDRYKCYAVNDVGRDEANIDVFIKDPFSVETTPSGITKFTYGTEATLNCPGPLLPMNIHWYYAKDMRGRAREIETSEKYEISASRTQLKIKKMDLDSVGRYACNVSLKYKNDALYDPYFAPYVNFFYVDVSFSTRDKMDGPIAPKVQGGTEIKVTAGKTAIIECKVVSGLPAPKITWLFGGELGLTFTPLAGSETVLRISNVEEKHKGMYKCVAENAAGKDEQITTLIVQVFPKITTKSSAVYQATEGELLLKIPCVAAGIPKPIIVWKLNGRDITPSAKYSIEDGTLTIKDPKVSDTNSYTCEARNEAGVVSSTFKTYIRQAPKISGVTVKKVRIGMPASIECTIEGEPKPTITWTFKDNSGSKFLPIPGSGKVLNFPRVEDKHAGNYKCIATNELGSNEHITTLFVGSAPEIIKNSTTVEGIEGDSALRIPCEVVGNPKPVITWKLKGATIIPDSKYTIEDGALVIKNPTEKDSALYTCEAKNYISTTSTTVQATVKILPVNTKPTVKISEGEAIEIEYNSTVKLTCKVVAFPEPKIEWIKNNGGRVPSKMSLQEYPYNYISYMDISYASERDRYKCYAVNDVGRDEANIDVFIKDPFPVETTPSGITKFTYGTEATLNCPGPLLPMNIHWYYAKDMRGRAREIETSEKYEISASRTQLKIKKMDLDSVGRYACNVSLKYKNDALYDPYFAPYVNFFYVDVSFSTRDKMDGPIAPKVQGGTEIKVTAGKTAIIECKVVSGLPAPKITWLFGGESGLTFTPLAGSETVLRISNVEEKHKGKYKCVAENAAGKDEQITTLIVQVFPKITTKSSAVYQATEGELLLKIPCVAAGIPKPIIVWKLNGRDITPSAKYSIEDGTLTIKDPKVNDTNSYTCEARNEAGAVSSTFKTYIRQAPKISGVTVKKVRIGMPASIECTIEGEPKPTITWTFKDNSGSKFLPIPGSGKVLNFPRAEDKNAGHYKCIATNELGSNEHITTLFVGSAPEIIKNSTTVEGIEGDSALRIPCEVVGNPKPVITWKLKGATIIPDSKYTIEDGALVIKNPTEKDSSLYTCEAKNYISTTSTTVQATVKILPVNTKPTVKISEGEAIEIEYNSTVKLTCKVVAFPEPKIEWIKNNGGRVPSKMSLQEYPYNYISYMDISYASERDRYKCYAVNDVGRDEANIDVFIKDPFPVETTRSGITKFTYGTEATLNCPGPLLPMNIHWHYAKDKRGPAREIETSDKYEISARRTQLKIKKMDLDSVGKYTCYVSLKNKNDALYAPFFAPYARLFKVDVSFSTRDKMDGPK